MPYIIEKNCWLFSLKTLLWKKILKVYFFVSLWCFLDYCFNRKINQYKIIFKPKGNLPLFEEKKYYQNIQACKSSSQLFTAARVYGHWPKFFQLDSSYATKWLLLRWSFKTFCSNSLSPLEKLSWITDSILLPLQKHFYCLPQTLNWKASMLYI